MNVTDQNREIKPTSKKSVSLHDAVIGSEPEKERTKIAKRLDALLDKISDYDTSSRLGPACGLGPRAMYAHQLAFPIIEFILEAGPDPEEWRLAGKVAGVCYKGIQEAGGNDIDDFYIRNDVHRRIWSLVTEKWYEERTDELDDELLDFLLEGINEGISNPRTDLSEIIAQSQADVEVARQERAAKALRGPEYGAHEGRDVEWPDQLGIRPHPKSPANIRAYLDFTGLSFKWNEQTQEVHVVGLPGKDRVDDALLSDLALGMNDQGCDVSLEFFHREVARLARQSAYHPGRQYFDAKQQAWDGKKRVERLFIDYAGAEDTPLNKAIGAAFAITFVRRVRSPGCPLYGFPILEGYVGGEGKSTFAQVLAGNLGFTDSLPIGASPKQTIEETRGVALAELGELVGLNDKGHAEVKAMTTRREDVARVAYGRTASAVPRAFSFIGTTNSPAYLKERGGLRRYWPIKVGVMDIEALKRDRDQLLGEAAYLEAQGASHNIPEDLWDAARKEQESRVISDPVEDVLEELLSTIEDGFVPSSALQSALEDRQLDWERAARSGIVARSMVKSGFVSKRIRSSESDARVKGYLRGGASASHDWYRYASRAVGLVLDKTATKASRQASKIIPLRPRSRTASR